MHYVSATSESKPPKTSGRLELNLSIVLCCSGSNLVNAVILRTLRVVGPTCATTNRVRIHREQDDIQGSVSIDNSRCLGSSEHQKYFCNCALTNRTSYLDLPRNEDCVNDLTTMQPVDCALGCFNNDEIPAFVYARSPSIEPYRSKVIGNTPAELAITSV